MDQLCIRRRRFFGFPAPGSIDAPREILFRLSDARYMSTDFIQRVVHSRGTTLCHLESARLNLA